MSKNRQRYMFDGEESIRRGMEYIIIYIYIYICVNTISRHKHFNR